MLSFINRKMNFTNDLVLTEEVVHENKAKRNTFKLLGNSMLGKFSQRANYSQTVFVNSQAEMEKAFSEHDIVDVLPISEDTCELEILSRQKGNPATTSRAGNCIIGAFVTAYARIQLHKDLMCLFSRGYHIYYVDTDAIIFVDPQPSLNRLMPLSLSPCLGDYKHELGTHANIKSFACLARKTYSISFLNENTKSNEVSVKSSGLSLSGSIAQNTISSKEFKILLKKWDKSSETSYVEIPQLRRFLNKNDGTVYHKISNQKLNNNINVQRIIQSVTSNTLPFGFHHANNKE